MSARLFIERRAKPRLLLAAMIALAGSFVAAFLVMTAFRIALPEACDCGTICAPSNSTKCLMDHCQMRDSHVRP